MNSKHWLLGWAIITLIPLMFVGILVYLTDPYMHFHEPESDTYFYVLNNPRSQNDGMTKHLPYDALITGTSMTENFKTSDMNSIFGCNSIKVPYSGGSYKEINDNISVSVKNNPDLKMVVRGLDMGKFFDEKDTMRVDMGEYPKYLYDANPLNDVKYIWNRDVIWNRVYKMLVESNDDGFCPGMTSFDEYCSWQPRFTFGVNSVCPDGIEDTKAGEPVRLTDAEKEGIKGNITQNVVALAKDNPDITFYYFFTPYSAAWWRQLVASGSIYRQIEAEKYIIELILECDNIQLYSFNNRMDITTNLNNYKDPMHYGQWINTLMLKWMHDGQYRITRENYTGYLEEELHNYLTFDYSSLMKQEDYESDFYMAALLNEELTGLVPVDVCNIYADRLNLSKASLVENQYQGTPGIVCKGRLDRETEGNVSILDYLLSDEYIGAKIELKDVDNYGYLVFYGKKISGNGQPTVYILNEAGEAVKKLAREYTELDNEWHQYLIDITELNGNITVLFNGGSVDNAGSCESEYVFSNIKLY